MAPDTSRDGRIRTGDPLNPIQPLDASNPGKNTCKPLVGRTICRSCLQTMPESAALNRPNNRPNRHKKWPNRVDLTLIRRLRKGPNPGKLRRPPQWARVWGPL